MLTDGVGHFGEPGAVGGLFQHVRSGEKLDAIGRGIAQRLEQPRCDEDGNIVRLAIQNPGDLLRQEAGGHPPREG